MNQLNKKQLDTFRGASGNLAKADSSSLSPLVSKKEDDKMKITITVSDDGIYRSEFYPSDEEDINNSKLGIESDSVIPTIKQLLKEFNVPLGNLVDYCIEDSLKSIPINQGGK